MNNFKKALGGLVAIPQWFVWRMVWNESLGKYDPKIPVSATGSNIDAQVQGNWMAFDAAVAQRNAQRMRETRDGVAYTLGFMFTQDCGYWFYDLDSCVVDGKLNEFTAGQYAHLHQCFFEFSSSDKGVHFIGRNVDGEKADRTRPVAGFGADIEFYTAARGIAFGLRDEGHGCADQPAPQEWMRWMVDSVLMKPTHVAPTGVTGIHDGNGPRDDWDGPDDDDELIELGHRIKSVDARFGQKASFTDLFNRDVDALCAAFPDGSSLGFDESRADMALAGHLHFLTGGHTDRIEGIMRMSKLARSKWDDRDDYLARTIGEVVRKAGNVYNKGHGRSVAPVLPKADEIGEAALKLKSDIEYRLGQHLNVDDVGEFGVCAATLHLIVTGTFWQTGSGKEIRVLSDTENLNQHGYERAYKFLTRKFGNPVNSPNVDRLARVALASVDVGATASVVDRFVRMTFAKVSEAILEHLEFHNQRGETAHTVDMFTDRSHMVLHDDHVEIVYEHKELISDAKADSPIEPKVIDDFKDHFPRFDELIDFIAAARFARDRKKAYLWIHAPSDWGKGLITDALMRLNCSVEVSMEEVERMLEGSPVGRTPISFRRKFVLSFNEVKSIKRELKEVESSIRITPKNQMTSSVDVYAKLLWSADSIPSLVGEEGVEDQLANRISVFREEGGAVDKRKMFHSVGAGVYADNVMYYMRDRLNAAIAHYRSLGVAESSNAGQRFLNDFHERYSIGKLYGTLNEALPRMAAAIISDVKSWPFQDQHAVGIRNVNGADGEVWYISKPRKFVNDWLFKTYSRSELAMHAPKVGELIQLISANGTGATEVVWHSGSSMRLLKLKS